MALVWRKKKDYKTGEGMMTTIKLFGCGGRGKTTIILWRFSGRGWTTKKIVGMSGTRKGDNEMALVIVEKKGGDLNCGTDSGKVRTTLTL